jgi:hypothetical protein
MLMPRCEARARQASPDAPPPAGERALCRVPKRRGRPDSDPGAIVGLVPAGHHDQRGCGGCNRQQYGHAGGLGPTCLGRPSDLIDEPEDRATSWSIVCHWHLLPFVSELAHADSQVSSRRGGGSWADPSGQFASSQVTPSSHVSRTCPPPLGPPVPASWTRLEIGLWPRSPCANSGSFLRVGLGLNATSLANAPPVR